MAEASQSYHETTETLSNHTLEMHRAIVSLQEELEAVDWYRQRADASGDDALREILLHNMREEIEHATMVLEWLRRNDEDFAGHMDTYLYTSAPITEVEESATGPAQAQQPAAGGKAAPVAGAGSDPSVNANTSLRLTVGSLKEHSA